MSTIRVVARDRWTSVDRRAINDDRLSFRALGLLVWLLDKPDDWETNSDLIARNRKEGRDAVRAVFRELEDHGYLERVKWRDESGHWQTRLDFYEQPRTIMDADKQKAQVSPATGFQASGTQASEVQASESQALIQKTDEVRLIQTTDKEPFVSEVASDSDATPDALEAKLTKEHWGLANLLADQIELNGNKRPNVTKTSANVIRLMMERDGRTYAQIENMIRWCQQDEFWRANVLSCSKLRDKYDQMKMQAMRTRKRGNNVTQDGRAPQSWANIAAVMEREGI